MNRPAASLENEAMKEEREREKESSSFHSRDVNNSSEPSA